MFDSTGPHNPHRPMPDRPSAAFLASPRFAAHTVWPELRGQRVLCIMDDANIRISANVAGGRFSYRQLKQHLDEAAAALEAWAVLAVADPGNTRMDYFRRRGWTPWAMLHERTDRAGRAVLRNADFEILTLCTERICRRDFDVILIGSGDGELVRALARAVRRVQPAAKVATLSIDGATSAHILTRNAPELIWANILVGADLAHAEGEPAAA